MQKYSIALIQIAIIVTFSLGAYQFTEDGTMETAEFNIEVTDSNGVNHKFSGSPDRVAITNTYAATVMRMLNVDSEIIVGVSGDFHGSTLWPEYADTPMVQKSAHSEIDFEALLDSRPDLYIVFATNGMVDTDAIREKLEPAGIKVMGLDFYKYDNLRYEIGVIAELFGKQTEAKSLFDNFDEIEGMVSSRIDSIDDSSRPRIVMEHHASLTRDPVVLTGTSQWNDIIHMAGGVNVFSNLPGHTTHVDMEAILDSNPDMLMFDGITFDIGFDSYDEEDRCKSHMEFIADRPGFDGMAAVVDGNMAIMSGEFAGPMMIHGLPTLAKMLHPDLFEDIEPDSYLDAYFTDYHGIERVGKFVCEYEISG